MITEVVSQRKSFEVLDQPSFTFASIADCSPCFVDLSPIITTATATPPEPRQFRQLARHSRCCRQKCRSKSVHDRRWTGTGSAIIYLRSQSTLCLGKDSSGHSAPTASATATSGRLAPTTFIPPALCTTAHSTAGAAITKQLPRCNGET